MGTVRKGKERDKIGSRERDTGSRTPRSRQQGAREIGANGQRAGEGGLSLVHGLTGVPKEGIGLVARCSPASHPASHRTISATTIPCGGDCVTTPTSVPGSAIASTRTAAPVGQCDDVGGAGREGRRAQEGMGQDSGRRQEAAGEGSKGHGRSRQGGRGVDGGTGQAAGREGAGSGGAAASLGGSSEQDGEGGEGGTGRQAARGNLGARGSPPTTAIQSAGSPAGAGG